MKLIQLLKNINPSLVVETINKISDYNHYKTNNIIETNFSFWYKKEKLNLSDKFINEYPYIYTSIEYIYYIITSTQYFRQYLFIDRIGYIVFTKNNFPILTIKDKSLIYDKSLVIDIGYLEKELSQYYNNENYWKLIFLNTFLNISISLFLLYKIIKK